MELVTYRMTGYAGRYEPDYGEANLEPQTFAVSSNISEEMLRKMISRELMEKSHVFHTQIRLSQIKSVPL